MKSKKNKDALPIAVTSSAGASAVAPTVSILPQLEAPAQASEHVTIELSPLPANASETVEFFSHRLGEVTHSLDRMYQDANTSVQSLNNAAGEAFRRQYELGVHFWEDLAVAKGPAEVLRLQVRFLSAQAELFTEQSKELQRQFAHMFRGPKA
jgi:hypothetical protein